MINHINKRKNRDSASGPVVKNLPANAGDTGYIPGPGRLHMPGGSKPRAPQLLKPMYPEPTDHNERGPHSEEPVPTPEASPCSLQVEKTHTPQWRSSTAKIQQTKSLKWKG